MASPNGAQAATLTDTPVANWNSKTFLVAGLLLVFLLILATRFPKYTTGFMLLLLVGVVLTHADIIKNFFSI